MQGAMGLSMLVWIQLTPGWENDPVWGDDCQQGIEGRAMSG